VTQSWYHIAVIGTDLSGLIFAALAARLGYRVVVIGQGDQRNAYKYKGFWFLRQLEHFIGFNTSPAVQKVFSELSLGLEMKNRPQAIETLQIAMPRMRLDLGGARRLWERDCERELPGGLPILDRLDARLHHLTGLTDPALGVDEGHTLRPDVDHSHHDPLSELSEYHDPFGITDPRLRAVVEAPLVHLAGLLSEPADPIVTARLWTHLRAGIHRFPGGIDGLKQVFVKKIRDQASDVRTDAYASSFVMRRGKIVAIELAERAESIGCELVVGNLDPRRLISLVPPDQRSDSWHSSLVAMNPIGWRMQVNVGVDPRVLPSGMGPELIWVGDPRGRLRGDNCLWISRPGIGPHASGDNRPSPGVVQLSALVEARSVSPTLAALQRTAASSLNALRLLVPWLDDHLKVVDVPALVDTPEGLHIDPDALAPVYGQALPDTLGASAFAAATPYKNLAFASDQRYAGLGFEGTCLGALHTLHLVRDKVRLHRGIRDRVLG